MPEARPHGTLHGVIFAPFVRKVRAVLAMKGIAYQQVSVMPGASGGALFDSYGRFAGLLTNKGGSAAIAPATLAQMRTRGQGAPPPEKQ